MSDDRRHAITIIAMLGSVFSPYYARARERGPADPLMHCAMNVALYGPRADRWALTERPRGAVFRSPRSLSIGPSLMDWSGDELRVAFDETTAPLPSRLAGTVRLRRPAAAGARGARAELALDGAGRHRWAPIAPVARAEVELTHPAMRFSGSAYLDTNAGDEPLERAFERWTWSRALGADGIALTYDVRRRDGSRLLLARAYDAAGGARELPPLAPRPLGDTTWGIAREIAADPGTAPRLLRTYEDTPFYARSLAAATFGGEPATVVHEALSLGRFASPWVQFLLPFRMRRSA
ncbi:hydroxyneurosporene synthase [Sorangium cellulosum]|uniref:Hydroxyneurosporene synthase n=1 Tax=Sorangium cellulosum TaxID=56 RepID=A0A2L0EJM1_SORCE|nr:carotenoid 1,2-hydratase [Sorangium cellulosum]AUX39454.1 hydroxyneurosporene synthase [Sorangium cellulosum]